MGRSHLLYKNIPKRTGTEFALERWRYPREEVAKGEMGTPLFDPTRCVRESWISFSRGWRHLSPRYHQDLWVTGSQAPLRPDLRWCAWGPRRESDPFPSHPPIPTPFKAATLLRPVPSGPSHLLRGTPDLAETPSDETAREEP